MSSKNTPSSIDNLNKFQKFFYEYGKYHRNPMNILIHVICIPIITLTFFLIFDDISFSKFKLPFNIFYVIYAIWVPIYIYTDVVIGGLTSIFYPALYYLTRETDFSCFGMSNFQIVLLIHVVAWVLQFIGHGAFEGRKPALMDNLLLMFNAPVFVFIEIFFFLGYKKEEISETLKYIDADILEYRKSKRS
jgi:uncharacterized membrane protein YGL010W